jgi:hypothetical protein
MTTTIRRNSLKRIEALVAACVLRSRYQDDGMDARKTAMSTGEVMALAPRFQDVAVQDDGCVCIGICHTVDFITCYPSIEVARKRLTADAFRKYFPNEAQS